jgi:hypothetical protein
MLRAAILCSGLFIVSASPAVAQSVIRLGESKIGSLQAGDRVSADGRFQDCYRLRANPGEWVVILLRSNRFDAQLDAGEGRSCDFVDGTVSDDDSAGYPHARLNLRPGRGDYSIRVSSYDVGEVGDYRLNVIAGAAPTADGPNPFRGGMSDLSLPVDPYDWVRPQEAPARYRWDAMCVAVNWVTRHERVAGPAAGPGQVEEETALLAAALEDSARLAGQDGGEPDDAWKGWNWEAMSFSHDGMIVPHPVTLPLQRACVKQLRASDPLRNGHRSQVIAPE